MTNLAAATVAAAAISAATSADDDEEAEAEGLRLYEALRSEARERVEAFFRRVT